LTGGVSPVNCDGEASFYLFVILQRYFIKSYAEKYNLKYMMNV